MDPSQPQPIMPPQNPAITPPVSPDSDKITTYSISTLVITFFLPFVGMIMAIIGLSKAKKTGSRTNKVIAICSLVYSLVIQVLIVAVFAYAWILAKNSPEFQQRKADQAAQEEKSEAVWDTVDDRMDVNQEEFDKIQTGMTKEEVGDITNSTDSFCEEDKPTVGATTCYWGPGAAIRKNISVVFENGVVVSKDKTGF